MADEVKPTTRDNFGQWFGQSPHGEVFTGPHATEEEALKALRQQWTMADIEKWRLDESVNINRAAELPDRADQWGERISEQITRSDDALVQAQTRRHIESMIELGRRRQEGMEHQDERPRLREEGKERETER